MKQAISIVTLGGGESLVGPMWYLIPLLEITVVFVFIVYFSEKLISKRFFREILVVVFIIGVMIAVANKGLPRHLSNAARLMVFYAAGFYCKEHKLFEYKLKWYIKSIVCCISVVVVCFCSAYSNSWKGENLLVVYISAFAGIIGCIYLSQLIVEYAHCSINKLLQYIGQNTMGILALHLLTFCFVKVIYVSTYNLSTELVGKTAAIGGENIFWKLMYIIIGLGMSLILYGLIKKIKYMINRLTKNILKEKIID